MKYKLLSSGAIFVMGAALSSPAIAQVAPSSAQEDVRPTEESAASDTAEERDTSAANPVENQPSEILVTAQRRSERVQDIPLAISAFGGETVAKLGMVSIENVAPRVPGFYFGSFGASRPQLYIRGIGTRSFDPGSESSVGVFVDEVYLGRASGSFGSLKDVERIEVLRGPQGTLYGRNTIAGAINVITKGPTNTLQGEVEVGTSNYDGYELFGAVGGPITDSGTVMFRIAGWRTYRDGYMTNLTTGNRFQGLDNFGGRARLAFRPVEGLRVDLTAELTDDGDEAAFAGFNLGSGPAQKRRDRCCHARQPASYFLGTSGNYANRVQWRQ
jgi:iron complex outermembrane receptor protein